MGHKISHFLALVVTIQQTEVVQDDGSLVRTIPVSHEGEIMMEILKHGSQVEVLEPEWLREKIIT